MSEQTCPICDRALGEEATISKHHLIPKSKGGRYSETILIHNICHQKIHSVFSTRELQEKYHTVEKIRNHEQMQKFIKWLSKKDVNFYQKNKRMKRR